jgi:helicase
MRISDLEKFGIPKVVLDVWRTRQGETLLPVQQKAVRRRLLERDDDTGRSRNMIVTSPTSSGKSFVAEMAALKAVTERRKAVLLFPLKSLAEEKFRLLDESYSLLGIRTLIVTGDHNENDSDFVRGNFQIAVAIFEKFDQLLTARIDLLGSIGLVAVDELQMIAEPGRGAVLERLLTKIRASVYSPFILGLSAVIGEAGASRLAEWLDAEIVEESSRPVELMRGVAADGSLRIRGYNSGEEGLLPFEQIPNGDEGLISFINQLKRESGSTLVFLKSRRDTVDLAFRLASSVNWPAAKEALAALESEEPSFLVRSLCQTLGRGVAFHNADLSSEQRSVVEEAFRRKAIRVLFSTTTLALGVNLPADTVYLETVKYNSGAYGGRPNLEPISRAEFDNMTGRAGRLSGQNKSSGKAVILADNDLEREILWNQYIADRECDEFKSAFESVPIDNWILHMVASRLARSEQDLENILLKTFRNTCGQVGGESLESGLERLAVDCLISRDETDGMLSVTASGKAAALAGLSCREAALFLRVIRDNPPQTVFGWMALAVRSPEWPIPPSILSWRERAENIPLKLLYQRFDHAMDEVNYLLPENHRRAPLEYRTAAVLKSLLVLDDWCRLTPVQRLEEQYQMHLGQIGSLAESVAHLVAGLALLVEATDNRSPIVEQLRQHAFSLRYGLPAEMQDLHLELAPMMRRHELAALWHAGISSIQALLEFPTDDLDRHLHDLKRLKWLKDKCEQLKQEVSMNAPYLASCQLLGPKPASIEVDGTYQGDRFLVKIDGFPIYLTGKSFKYFTKLAWARAHKDAGWIYKEDIEVGFNQARYLYRLKNEINTSLRSNWLIFENNRLGYYRLDIDPEKVSFNLENLRNHPDYEVQALVPPSKPAVATLGAPATC